MLAPTAIAIAYAGGWLWTALVTLAAIGLYVEWLMIVGSTRETSVAVVGIIALVLSGTLLAVGRIGSSLVASGLGLAAVVWLSPAQRGWNAAGFLYASAAAIASVMVRLDHAFGFVALLLILLLVWVTDIGGYFAGRGLGGPKLWPRVSPKKTWAGAIGGFVASLIVAAGFVAFGVGKSVPLLLLGAVLSVASQLGDLFEVGREAAVRRQGLQPSHSGARRTDGSPRRLCRRRCAGGDFRVFSRWRGWRRPRSYGLVKI